MNVLGDKHKADLEGKEAFEDQTRKKYQKEMKSLLTDLETEKNTSINLKESVRDLEKPVSAPLLLKPEVMFSKEEYAWRVKYMAASMRNSRDRLNKAKLEKDERYQRHQ